MVIWKSNKNNHLNLFIYLFWPYHIEIDYCLLFSLNDSSCFILGWRWNVRIITVEASNMFARSASKLMIKVTERLRFARDAALSPLLAERSRYLCFWRAAGRWNSCERRKEDFPLIPWCFVSLLSRRAPRRSVCVKHRWQWRWQCVRVCHPCTTCWCPAQRAVQSSARTSCVSSVVVVRTLYVKRSRSSPCRAAVVDGLTAGLWSMK